MNVSRVYGYEHGVLRNWKERRSANMFTGTTPVPEPR